MKFSAISAYRLANVRDPAPDPANALVASEEFQRIAEDEAEINRRAFHIAAQVLAEIGRALTHHSSQSAAVAHALGLHEPDGSLAKTGERLGMSKQALGKYVGGLRAIFAAAIPAHHKLPVLERPTIPGRWLTRPEVGREFYIEPATADRLGCQTVVVSGIKFWSAEDLRRLLDQKAQLDAARRYARMERNKNFSSNQSHDAPN